MHFKTTTASFLLTLAALVQGQGIADLPSCATAGALAAIAGTNCATTDIACICNSASFTSALQSYAQAHCSADDYNTAIAKGQSICANAGVTVGATGASSTPDAAFSATATGFDVSATQATSVATANGTAATATDSMTMTDPTSTERCECEDDMPSMTSAAAVGTYTGAAGSVRVGKGAAIVRALVGLGAGVVALL